MRYFFGVGGWGRGLCRAFLSFQEYVAILLALHTYMDLSPELFAKGYSYILLTVNILFVKKLMRSKTPK